MSVSVVSGIASLRGKGTSTSIVSGGRRKIHTTFEHGEEMVSTLYHIILFYILVSVVSGC